MIRKQEVKCISVERLVLTMSSCFVCAFEITVAFLLSAHVPYLLTQPHLMLLNKESNILNISSGHLWCKILECSECHDKILVKMNSAQGVSLEVQL